MHQLMNYYIYVDLLLNTNNKTILQLLQARQKKWYGHGRTGRTADYGLACHYLDIEPERYRNYQIERTVPENRPDISNALLSRF